MLVRDFMTPHPITVNEHTTVADAREALRTHGIHGLPVTRGDDQLVGIITDRDLRETTSWLPLVAAGISHDVRRAIDECEVGVLMAPNPMTIAPNAPLEDAAALMRSHRIGGLPVLEGEIIAGIITETDVLRAFEVTLGAETGTFRTLVEVNDPGVLWRQLQMLEESDNPATHVVTFRDRRNGHLRALVRTDRRPGA